MENLNQTLEGLLFLAGEEGLSVHALHSVLTDCSRQDIEEGLQALQKEYEETNRGFELANFGGRYKLISKDCVYEYAKKLFGQIKTVSLSQPAMETLAIIAYKQPVTRAEIEEIRGVSSDMMLKKLTAKGLVETCGRLEAVGRPVLYKVTTAFLDAFSLESLEELPALETVKGQENLFEEE
jgi:segregation and condensation protein B